MLHKQHHHARVEHHEGAQLHVELHHAEAVHADEGSEEAIAAADL